MAWYEREDLWVVTVGDNKTEFYKAEDAMDFLVGVAKTKLHSYTGRDKQLTVVISRARDKRPGKCIRCGWAIPDDYYQYCVACREQVEEEQRENERIYGEGFH